MNNIRKIVEKELKPFSGMDQNVKEELRSLINEGNQLCEAGDNLLALKNYEEAWKLLPEPKLEWELFSSWLTGSFYNAYFDLGEFEKAIYWANLVKSVHSDDTPFIYLGKAYFELNEFEEAYQYFNQAYEIGKFRVFREEPKKYWEFYKERKEKIEAEAKAKKKAKK